MYEYETIDIHLNLIDFNIKTMLGQNTKCLSFLKNVRIFPQNLRELGSQVPDFFHVCFSVGHQLCPFGYVK